MKFPPKVMMWVHGAAGVLFIAVWIIAALVGWVNNPAFISHVSMVALVYAAFAGWQGAQAADEAHDDET